jgi:hypothetical protein
MHIRATLSMLVLAFPLCAKAESAVGRVSGLGCHNIDNTCWVQVEGFSSSTYCNHSDQIRWNAGSTWGARWYATFLAAQMSGKRVFLEVHSTACDSQGYPTFVFGNIAD